MTLDLDHTRRGHVLHCRRMWGTVLQVPAAKAQGSEHCFSGSHLLAVGWWAHARHSSTLSQGCGSSSLEIDHFHCGFPRERRTEPQDRGGEKGQHYLWLWLQQSTIHGFSENWKQFEWFSWCPKPSCDLLGWVKSRTIEKPHRVERAALAGQPGQVSLLEWLPACPQHWNLVRGFCDVNISWPPAMQTGPHTGHLYGNK
jgi:hypothetical protein